MKKLGKIFNNFNNLPLFKKNKHPKDETPIEENNEQSPENANDNAVSSGSANAKNVLSSGSSQKAASPITDEANDEKKLNVGAASRPNYQKSSNQQRRTMPPGSAIQSSAPRPNNYKSEYVRNDIKQQSPNVSDFIEKIPERDVLSTFQNSFSERITINLPLDELNASSLRADVLLSMVKDKAELLDRSVSDTEKKVDDVSSQMKLIINKSRSITQTATVINAKLVNIDEWIDRIGSDKSDFKINIVEFFVSLFSILTTILSLMWFSLRRKSTKGKKSI